MKHLLSFLLAFLLSFTISFATQLPEEASPADPAVTEQVGESEEEVIDEEAVEEPVEGSEAVFPSVPETIVADTLNIEAGAVTLAVPEDNEYPTDAPLVGGVYMQVDTSELGEVMIYVPTDYQYRSFTFDESGNVVNIRGSTITGVLYDGNTVYSVRFTSFGNPSYRLNSSNYTWDELTVTDVVNTNIVFIESNEDLPPVPDSDMLSVIIISLLGVIVLCHFMKRY